METQLVKSAVIFNEEEHTYTLGDVQLSGITSIIHRYIFPNMYAGISQSVLNKAAERGSDIHKSIELLIAGVLNPKDTEETRLFADATNGINFLASEYLVSDEEAVASCIDLVAEKDDNIVLYDIKTTSVLNIEYLQWQLSIYAYLFEKQNMYEKLVNELYAIHIRNGKCEIVPIERLPDEYVEALLDAYKNDEPTFENPLHQVPTEMADMLKEYADIEVSLAEIESIKTPLDERKKQIADALADIMRAKGLKKLDTDAFKITIGDNSERESFDLKAFRTSELFTQNDYSSFIKKTEVKGRVTITIK